MSIDNIAEGMIAERDILGPPIPPPSIVRGTIGWIDATNHFDLGQEEESGPHLFRVTLFAGKDPNTAPKPGVATGRQVVCQLGLWPMSLVPPAGMQCLVAFADRDFETPGAGVII